MSIHHVSEKEQRMTHMLNVCSSALKFVTAERDALKENYTLACEILDMMIGGAVNMLDIARDADRLAEERDALRADAERYRWLRDMDMLDSPSVDLATAFQKYAGGALDAAIDAAMKGKS